MDIATFTPVGLVSCISMKVKDLPALDRPREKLAKKGAKALSEFELLQVLIGSGNRTADVSQLAINVQKLLSKGLDDVTYANLMAIKGLSDAKASTLLAALELSERYVLNNDEPLLTSDEFANVLKDISLHKQEHMVCLSLDGANRLIARRTITVGVLDKVIIHPREIFADAITDRAASIVIGHNHPSGDKKPSNFDIGLTQQLVAASRIIGINLLDHIIICKSGFTSFKDEGLL